LSRDRSASFDEFFLAVQAGAKIVVRAAREREQDRQQRPLAKAEVSVVRSPTTAHPRRTTKRTGARGGALSRAAQKEDSRFRITPRRAVIVAPPPPCFSVGAAAAVAAATADAVVSS